MPRLPERRRPVEWTVQTWEIGRDDHPDPDVPVWISIRKFDALWRRTKEYIADAGGPMIISPTSMPGLGLGLDRAKPAGCR